MAKGIVTLPGKWMGGSELDAALLGAPQLFASDTEEVEFRVPKKGSLRISVCIQLLSLANQLDSEGKTVSIIFEEENAGAMSYLNRMGFFDYLSSGVTVLPSRPEITRRMLYQGRNRSLVEIVPISPTSNDKNLPKRLAETAQRAHKDSAVGKRLGDAVFTVFAELIGNVYDHSETKLDGFAALQSYPRSQTIEVAVSDSGIGILETLKPALVRRKHPYAKLNDAELLFRAITEGVSSNDESCGCGLCASATQALQFGAHLEIRLPECRVDFVPMNAGYNIGAVARGQDKLPHMAGTHICFDFRLDR